jgi:hypothetical protein
LRFIQQHQHQRRREEGRSVRVCGLASLDKRKGADLGRDERIEEEKGYWRRGQRQKEKKKKEAKKDQTRRKIIPASWL